MKQTHHLVLVSGVFGRQIPRMNFARLVSFAFVLAAPVCLAQLPPSLLQPGKPIAPIPAAPAPAAPVAPAAEAPAAAPTSTVPNTLTTEEVAMGWKLLFDGKRLLGMKGLQKTDPLSMGWKIQDGELALPKEISETFNSVRPRRRYWRTPGIAA